MAFRTAAERRASGAWWPLTWGGGMVCAASLLLTFSPELLHVVNRRRWEAPWLAPVVIHVSGVKCEACASRLRSALASATSEQACAVAVKFVAPPAPSLVTLSLRARNS